MIKDGRYLSKTKGVKKEGDGEEIYSALVLHIDMDERIEVHFFNACSIYH